MTIKFQRYADNYMCKDYYYRIYNTDSIAQFIQMEEYQFEKLFNDMAIELGYDVIKIKQKQE
jgi:hypothetical protein